MMLRWYTVQILPNLKHTAEANLKRQNYNPFFPEIIDKKNNTTPLFKGYGFVQLDIDIHQWRSVNGTRGVIQLIPKLTNEKALPKPIDSAFVEELLANNPVSIYNALEIIDEFVPGLLIKIKDDYKEGLLPSRVGTIERILGKRLEIVLITVLENYNNKIIIPTTEVELYKAP